MTPQYNLLGEFSVSLDAKGRFRLPGSLLKSLGDRDTLKFVINRGLSNCLTLYPLPVWDEERKPYDALNKHNERARMLHRLFYRGASDVVPDSADRILIPKELQELLREGMEEGTKLKALKVVGLQDRIEIWSEAEYVKVLEEEMGNFGDLSELLLGGSPPQQPF